MNQIVSVSSYRSFRFLKCICMHNGNQYPLIIGHIKETYENGNFRLNQVCGDFKIINFSKGLQGGYTKHYCFFFFPIFLHFCFFVSFLLLRHWPSKRTPYSRQTKHELPALGIIGESHMPPLHIRLDLVKQVVKALNTEGEVCTYISNMFPHLSKAKLEGGIFTVLDVPIIV